ncbi:Retinoid-inducible serine carboxypeptidase [Eumeta japonica]|uniref:Retinoid-inducible serine carboxypeptidase n=1 Tax=Eumeta variegata TaxID=151549 RepID=A0A4C1VJB6_EUMVA|nr:Retinoid-inducible serine carboxypeptidase [Eumeta japonica]
MVLEGQLDTSGQSYGYVTVREGAHMFYWLYYTTADVATYTERPLIVWLQGGPGGSSTGIGNFEILGPVDIYFQERDHTWVRNFNVLFVDNPVGTGFSYVDDLIYLTTTNEQIGKHSIHLQAFHGNYWQRLPEIACQQYHQAAKDVVISPKILQCEVKCFK